MKRINFFWLMSMMLLLTTSVVFASCNKDGDVGSASQSSLIGTWKLYQTIEEWNEDGDKGKEVETLEDDGEWEILTFNEDGTWQSTQYFGGKSSGSLKHWAGTYTVKSGVMYIDFTSCTGVYKVSYISAEEFNYSKYNWENFSDKEIEAEEYRFSVSGSTLTRWDEGSDDGDWWKDSEIWKKLGSEDNNSSSSSTSSSTSKVVGSWKLYQEDEDIYNNDKAEWYVITFKKDGTYTRAEYDKEASLEYIYEEGTYAVENDKLYYTSLTKSVYASSSTYVSPSKFNYSNFSWKETGATKYSYKVSELEEKGKYWSISVSGSTLTLKMKLYDHGEWETFTEVWKKL